MDYEIFQIEVGEFRDGTYTTRVLSSPAGEAISGFASPDPFQITALRSRLAAKRDRETQKAFGGLLFEALFADEMRTLFRSALKHARACEGGLRVLLTIQRNELSALPWEFLLNPWAGDMEARSPFMALNPETPLSRYVRLPHAPRARQFEPPLRILALFPSPATLPPLDIAREREVMQDALAPLLKGREAELIVLEHATLDQMIDALEAQPIHILYYQGHIGFDPQEGQSYFCLETPHGGPFAKLMAALSYTLRRTGVPLVAINSEGMSASTLAYELARYGAPAVVATQEPLSDEESFWFFRYFHEQLADGAPVDVALNQGRWAIGADIENGRWASPVLVSGVPDTSLIAAEGQR